MKSKKKYQYIAGTYDPNATGDAYLANQIIGTFDSFKEAQKACMKAEASALPKRIGTFIDKKEVV